MLFKVLDIRIKSPILVNILNFFYTGTSAAIYGSNVYKRLRDAAKAALNPLYFLILIWILFWDALSMKYSRNSLLRDWSTHTVYQAIALLESNVACMAWLEHSASEWFYMQMI